MIFTFEVAEIVISVDRVKWHGKKLTLTQHCKLQQCFKKVSSSDYNILWWMSTSHKTQIFFLWMSKTIIKLISIFFCGVGRCRRSTTVLKHRHVQNIYSNMQIVLIFYESTYFIFYGNVCFGRGASRSYFDIYFFLNDDYDSCWCESYVNLYLLFLVVFISIQTERDGEIIFSFW